MLKIIFLALVLFLNSCISISKIERSHENISPVQNQVAPEEFQIFLMGHSPDENDQFCIDEDQKAAVRDWVNRYYKIDKNEKVSVYLQLKRTTDLALILASTMVSVLTFTIIPAYGSMDFLIDVKISNGDKVKFWSAKSEDAGLISVLVLPWMYSRHLFKARRNNIQNAFYRASLEAPKSEGSASKFLDLKPTLNCRTDFSLTDRTGAMPW